MNIKHVNLLLLLLLTSVPKLNAQEAMAIWPEDKMPNSRGMKLDEIEVDERITQVATPGIYSFFPSKEENKGAAVLICPGGGYYRLAHHLCGFQLAKWLNTIGVSAFVLKYRLPHSPDLIERHTAPLQDAQRAMRMIRANAEKWSINPDKIGIMGTSAGGHLASTLGTHSEDVSAIGDPLDKLSFRPNFLILISPVISMGTYTHTGSHDNLLGDNPSKELVEKYSNELQVTSATPPSFLVHAIDDHSVSPRNSMMFFQALIDNNVSASLHIFPQGKHEISITRKLGSAALWTSLCEMWLKEMGFI